MVDTKGSEMTNTILNELSTAIFHNSSKFSAHESKSESLFPYYRY